MTRSIAAGYSGTPLAKKLGIKQGSQVLLVGAPDDYESLLAPLPPGVCVVAQEISEGADQHHRRHDSRSGLAAGVRRYQGLCRQRSLVGAQARGAQRAALKAWSVAGMAGGRAAPGSGRDLVNDHLFGPA